MYFELKKKHGTKTVCVLNLKRKVGQKSVYFEFKNKHGTKTVGISCFSLSLYYPRSSPVVNPLTQWLTDVPHALTFVLTLLLPTG